MWLCTWRAALTAALVLPAGASHTLSFVNIDFQPADAMTAPGYVAVGQAHSWQSGTPAIIGAGARGAWAGPFKAHFADLGPTHPDPLTRDCVLWDATDPPGTFRIQSVQPGTYDLTIHAALSYGTASQTVVDVDEDDDGAADVSLAVQTPRREQSKTVSVKISAAGVLSLTIHGMGEATGVLAGLNLVAAEPDDTAPEAIGDLVVVESQSQSIALRWTAPADDLGTGGRVARYDVRCAHGALDESNWSAAMRPGTPPSPSNPGCQELFVASQLTPGTTYRIAVASSDRWGNVSDISNIVEFTTQERDVTGPAGVEDLKVDTCGPSHAVLRWTAVGDDGTSGKAAVYDLRYSTRAITNEAEFDAAHKVVVLRRPRPDGATETALATGLTGGTQYHFAVRVTDESSNTSPLSNVALGTTLNADDVPPAKISDLEAVSVNAGSVALSWTAVGDDGQDGSAAHHDLRYSTKPIANEVSFANARRFAGTPAPQASRSTQRCVVWGLQPNTEYYFAVKAADDAVPANLSEMSNMVRVRTTPPKAPTYALSNQFSLEPDVRTTATSQVRLAIKDVRVEQATIARTQQRYGPVYTGSIHYALTAPVPYVHVWLELSTDGGQTWSERRIHAVGAVGMVQPGAGKVARWLIDGDHGPRCRIRIRAQDAPATYSDLDRDENKYPRPAPWDRYANLERLTDRRDFDFEDVRYHLPKLDFYKSAAAGQIQAGFARVRFFHDPGTYLTNPHYFLHCLYLESPDTRQKWVILQADVQHMWTETIHHWREQIHEAFDVPHDHIMVLVTHVHNHADRVAGIDRFPIELLQEAMAGKHPVEIGFLNKDMGTTYNVHRNLLLTPDRAASSFTNDNGAQVLPIQWEYNAFWEPIAALLDGSAYDSKYQRYFDCPLDSYLQMIVFRHAATHQMTGVLVKFTTHPCCGDYPGDLPRAVMDTIQQRLGPNVEVMYTSGFAGNHRPLVAQHCPPEKGSLRVAKAFARTLADALPAMEFQRLTRLGMVMGYDTFGAYVDDAAKVGTDPDRLGVGVQVFRFNDVYLSVLPGEAPSEQGLYIRARTSDLKHMYNAYGNTWYEYYTWGRWFDITHYEGADQPNRFESFRMAQEVVRGVNILEQAFVEQTEPDSATRAEPVDP